MNYPGWSRRKGFRASVALVIATLGWAMAPVFIRLCSADFDPFTQAFARYLSGSGMLAGICLLRWRREFLSLLRNPLRLAPISALNVFMQYIWTVGCYGTPATTAQLIVKLNIVFVIAFAYLLFQEERAVIRDWRYGSGTIISLVGLLFVLMQDPSDLVPVLNAPVLLLLLMSLTWAVYVVWGKHLAWKIHPVPMFGVMSLQTAIGLGALAFAFGDPVDSLSIPPRIWTIAIVSGFISIGFAHPAFQYAQRELGSAFCTAINLVNPLFTFLFSLALLPNERLQPQQWAGAAALLMGTGFVLGAAHSNRARDVTTADPE
ncbi:MAG: hypothetical protein AMXMBFR4_25020 [Candidatus Hydrogenedentota bacterium]